MQQEVKLKPFKNFYCDGVLSALGKYIDVYNIDEDAIYKLLSKEEMEALIETTVLKNKRNGVKELYIKVPYVNMGVKFLDKHQIRGKEILSARHLTALTAGEIVGGRIGFDVENLLDYAEGFLSEVSDLTGRLDIPIFISFGRDIEEVGKLVNRYKQSPAEILENFGFLDRECYLYGLNYIDKDDLKLIRTYNPTIIFMPKNDGEEGRGQINLYNFVYNEIKFCFSTGRCYNIDMLGELKLAVINTSNLMHERGLISANTLISAIEIQESQEELTLLMDEDEKEENILDKRIELDIDLSALEEKTRQIAKRIKEKI